MNTLESFKIALQAIFNNKTRALLTMLGLIIGISSVVAVVSIGSGVQTSIMSDLDSLGANVITIMPNRNATLTYSENFTYADLEAIEEKYSDKIVGIQPQLSVSGTIIEDVTDTDINLSSAIVETMAIEGMEIVAGRDFTDMDVEESRNNILIDSELAEEMFGTRNGAVGEKIYINSNKHTSAYNIIGVYESSNDAMGYSTQSAYVPYTTLNKNYNLLNSFSTIKVAAEADVNATELGNEIITYIEHKKDNVGENKYTLYSLEDQMEMITSIQNQMILMVAAIAAISLVVGGIGVMNIMLVSVTERTREIGIRKALGAKHRDILLQFLIESVVVAGVGGILGTIFGFVFTNVASGILDIPLSVNATTILIATAFSAGIGIIFGVYPANKAARLDPIEALRYE